MEAEEDGMITRIKYRSRYYWRKFIITIGICPECHNVTNRKPNGRRWCPECGRANL